MNGVTEAFPLAVTALLIDLESRDVRVTICGDRNELVVEPADALTAADRKVIENHFDALFMAAAFATDAGVRARVRGFAGRTDTNCWVPDAPYAVGRCFSCGCECDVQKCPRRCWRCRIAWQLACALRNAMDRCVTDKGSLESDHVESCG